MAMGAGPSRGIKSDINVTPLVDVVLVLLIIFMVVTPMLQRGKDVHLPQAHKPDAEVENADPLILSMTQDNRVWVERDAYDDPGLKGRLANEFIKTPGRRVLLKGDQSLSVGDVRHVMDLAKQAGAKGISLGVEEQKK